MADMNIAAVLLVGVFCVADLIFIAGAAVFVIDLKKTRSKKQKSDERAAPFRNANPMGEAAESKRAGAEHEVLLRRGYLWSCGWRHCYCLYSQAPFRRSCSIPPAGRSPASSPDFAY